MTAPASGIGAQVDLLRLDDPMVSWFVSGSRPVEFDNFARGTEPPDPVTLGKEFRARMAGYPGVVGIHGPVPTPSFAAFDPDIQQIIDRRFATALSFCEDIGASYMVLHSPFLFLGAPYVTQGNGSVEQDAIEHAARAIAPTLSLAEEIGCTLVIENVWDPAPDLLIRFANQIASEHLRLSLDVGHARVAGGALSMPADYWVRSIGPLLAHLHISDSDGYADRHWPVGTGSIDWGPLMHSIAAISKASPPSLILEYRRLQRVPRIFDQSVEHLAEMSARFG